MSFGAALRRPVVIIGASGAFVAALLIAKGAAVAGWAAVGVVGTGGYLLGTWLAIRMASGFAKRDVRAAGLVLGLALFLKVGPIVALALAAKDAPPACRDGLAYGAAVVYSWLVGWGLTPVSPCPTDDP